MMLAIVEPPCSFGEKRDGVSAINRMVPAAERHPRTLLTSAWCGLKKGPTGTARRGFVAEYLLRKELVMVFYNTPWGK